MSIDKEKLNNAQKFALRIARFGNLLEDIEYSIGIFAVTIFLIVVFLNVIFREFLTPLSWADEVSRFAFIWAIFIGAGIGIRNNSHFTIDILMDILGNSSKKHLDFICKIMTMIFVIFLFVYGIKFAILSFYRTSYPSGIRLIFSTVGIPIGSLFMIYFAVENIILSLVGLDIKRAKELLGR